MTDGLERTLEALLFLSADPVSGEALAEATGAELHEVDDRARAPARVLRVRAPRVRRARARRRLHAHHPRRRRACRPPAAGPAAHPGADPGPGRDAGHRRLPAAGVAARDRPHPRRQRRVGGGHAAGARGDRGGGAVAVRGGAVPDHRAVLEAVRPAVGGRAAGDRGVRPLAGGRAGAARAAAAGRRGPGRSHRRGRRAARGRRMPTAWPPGRPRPPQPNWSAAGPAEAAAAE